jgi:hypothetical protein
MDGLCPVPCGLRTGLWTVDCGLRTADSRPRPGSGSWLWAMGYGLYFLGRRAGRRRGEPMNNEPSGELPSARAAIWVLVTPVSPPAPYFLFGYQPPGALDSTSAPTSHSCSITRATGHAALTHAWTTGILRLGYSLENDLAPCKHQAQLLDLDQCSGKQPAATSTRITHIPYAQPHSRARTILFGSRAESTRSCKHLAAEHF